MGSKFQNKKVVLFFHGNAGNISHRLDTLKIINDLGFNVFMIDYRGYGKSSGKASENASYLDAMGAYNYLKNEKKYSSEDIIIWGRSLGGAIAIDLSYRLKNKVAALVVESSFTSIPAMAKKQYPFLATELLCRIRYDSLQKIDKVYIPSLFIHSLDDELVPYAHGKALFNKANEPKFFLEIRGDHNSAYLFSRKIYIKELERFFVNLKSL